MVRMGVTGYRKTGARTGAQVQIAARKPCKRPLQAAVFKTSAVV